MSCWAVIPIKPPGEGKRRLAAALSPHERQELVSFMLERVVSALHAVGDIDQVCLLGSGHTLRSEIKLLVEPPPGLNAALQWALPQLLQASVSRVLFLPADLPSIGAGDVELLVRVPPLALAIAPDHTGRGTNALSLPLPAASDFSFAFGHDSFRRHTVEAHRLGLALHTIRSGGLAYDVDEPSDLSRIGRCLGDIRRPQ